MVFYDPPLLQKMLIYCISLSLCDKNSAWGTIEHLEIGFGYSKTVLEAKNVDFLAQLTPKI